MHKGHGQSTGGWLTLDLCCSVCLKSLLVTNITGAKNLMGVLLHNTQQLVEHIKPLFNCLFTVLCSAGASGIN